MFLNLNTRIIMFKKSKIYSFPRKPYVQRSYCDLNEYISYVHKPVKFILTNTDTGFKDKELKVNKF